MENIKEYLQENNFEIVSKGSNQLVISYSFDLVEMDAAKAFLNDEITPLDNEKENEYQQYLKEIASDNLDDALEEILEELDIKLSFEIAEFEGNKQFFIIKKV